MLISGNFRQLLPVIERSNWATIVNHTLNKSCFEDNYIITLSLRKNMRVKNVKDKHPDNVELHQQLECHGKWLLEMDEDKIQSYGTYDGSNIIEITPNICCERTVDVISNFFEEFQDNIGNSEYINNRILLGATNEIVNKYNNKMVYKYLVICTLYQLLTQLMMFRTLQCFQKSFWIH